MRAAPLLITTLLLAAPVFAQQASSPTPIPVSAPTATADQPPAHPITPEQFHELYELTGANKIKSQMVRAMWANVQRVAPPYMPKDVMDELQSDLENLDLEPVQLRIYQKYISAEDAAEIIAFDKTPAGQRMIRVAPQLAKEILMGNQELGQQIGERVVKEHSAEIKAAAAKYQQEHSDTPTVTSPN